MPLITRISTAPPPRLAPPVPHGLNEVLAHGMAKRPSDRIQTALELEQRLRAVANGQPATAAVASPPAPPRQASPWAPPASPAVSPAGPSSAAPSPAAAVAGRSEPQPPGNGTMPPAAPWPGAGDHTIPAQRARRANRSGLVIGAAIAVLLIGALGVLAVPLLLLSDTDSSSEPPQSQPDTPPPDGASTTVPVEPAGGQPTSSASESGTATSLATEPTQPPEGLSDVLLTPDDLPGSIVQGEESAETGSDSEHPLHDYSYCGTPDTSQVGAGHNRLLVMGLLDLSSVVASSIMVTESPEVAAVRLDQIVSDAAGCTEPVDSGFGLTDVSVSDAQRTEQGARIQLQVISPLDAVDLLVVLIQVDGLIVGLEISPDSEEIDRLSSLLVERASQLEL